MQSIFISGYNVTKCMLLRLTIGSLMLYEFRNIFFPECRCEVLTSAVLADFEW